MADVSCASGAGKKTPQNWGVIKRTTKYRRHSLPWRGAVIECCPTGGELAGLQFAGCSRQISGNDIAANANRLIQTLNTQSRITVLHWMGSQHLWARVRFAGRAGAKRMCLFISTPRGDGRGYLQVHRFFFVPVVGVVGAVIAWAYQSGSARLGVIDLFACEISTLCRVATVVDTAAPICWQVRPTAHIGCRYRWSPPAARTISLPKKKLFSGV